MTEDRFNDEEVSLILRRALEADDGAPRGRPHVDPARGLEWKAQDVFGGRYLSVRSENGRTRVEALGNFRDGAFVSADVGGTAGLALAAVALKTAVGLTAQVEDAGSPLPKGVPGEEGEK